ncbi:MAG TPA: hypothetical protein VJ717_01825 [Gemmatimonadaceae bacterium]|nr:hypothetical protein [Gemmatimonadaceae bacterium]
MSWLRWGLVVAGILAATSSASAQSRAVRFEVTAVGDSTIDFNTGAARWIRPGQLGVAVDPRRRDLLIARFKVQTVREGSATAVITGQTSALAVDHVAVLNEPRRSAYQSPAFWIGIVVGGALGLIGGLASR